jgi:cellulose biosynthesis protein BcsQ
LVDVTALATSKGGAGKSTPPRPAAHWLALGRKPALIDADLTGTLSKRYNPHGPLAPSR